MNREPFKHKKHPRTPPPQMQGRYISTSRVILASVQWHKITFESFSPRSAPRGGPTVISISAMEKTDRIFLCPSLPPSAPPFYVQLGTSPTDLHLYTCTFLNLIKDNKIFSFLPQSGQSGKEEIMWTLRQSELNSNLSSHPGFLLCEMRLMAPIPQKCEAQRKNQSQSGLRSQLHHPAAVWQATRLLWASLSTSAKWG